MPRLGSLIDKRQRDDDPSHDHSPNHPTDRTSGDSPAGGDEETTMTTETVRKNGETAYRARVIESAQDGDLYHEVWTCPKCGGRGKFRCWSHIERGDCFKCGGVGQIRKTFSTSLDTRAKAAGRSAVKRHEAHMAEVALAEIRAAEQALIAAWTAEVEAEEKAAKPDVMAGDRTLEVTILGVKFKRCPYSGAEKPKILVETVEGETVYGSMPAKVERAFHTWLDAHMDDDHTGIRQWARGVRFAMTAQVEPSRDDPKFGFFKRPKKISILSSQPA